MCLRIIPMAAFRESSIKGLTLQYSVGVAKLSVERGFSSIASVRLGDGLLSVIRSSGVSAIQGFLMY